MATNHYRRSNKPKSDPIEYKIVLAVLRGVWWLITLPFKGLGQPNKKPQARKAVVLDTAEVSRRWTDIQTSIGLGGATHFASAVVASDKLLDYVLKQKGYPGETMGDRLIASKEDVSPAVYHNVWQAHKLRNQLVHEVGAEIMSYQAKEAIQNFEAMLRELGALK